MSGASPMLDCGYADMHVNWLPLVYLQGVISSPLPMLSVMQDAQHRCFYGMQHWTIGDFGVKLG